MKIVFFGTPDFAVGTLSRMVEGGFAPLAVVTRPDTAKGRSGTPSPSPVKEYVQTHLPGVPVLQPEKASSPAFVETLSALRPDLFVVVAYGEIVSEELLALPQKASINVHASLLPKLRGAAPIHRAIIEGKRETGVTIMHMVKKMDAGDMIRVAKVPIGPDTNVQELHDRLMEVGGEELVLALRDLEKGRATRTPQDESQVTFAKKIELEDCEVHWDRPAAELHNLIRGTNPFPGAWCWVFLRGEKKRLKILQTKIPPAGEGELVVPCGEGVLSLERVKLEGKGVLSGGEFARGYPTIKFS